LKMLEEIGKVENIPAFIASVKRKERKLFGFGHRVYKSYDPRAKILKGVCDEVFGLLGKNPLMEVAMELEKQALSDPYFRDRSLYPNVDFYSGIIYKTMGFPTDMFPVLFSIPRCAGWLAHWVEMIGDQDLKIFRPRQVYVGNRYLSYVDLKDREDSKPQIPSLSTDISARRIVSGDMAIPKTVYKKDQSGDLKPSSLK